MAEHATYRVSRVPVAAEPLLATPSYDYADSFEVRLAQPDDHTAQEWMRAAVEQAAPAVRGFIRFAHGRIARFAPSSDDGSLLGWQTLSSSRDAFHLAAEGPLLRAEIVARRTSDRTATVSTFLFYKHGGTPLLWRVLGPLHRRIAPYLLARAAAHLTRVDDRV